MQKSINALPKGFKLSTYEIEEELGSGGFGITYKAYDPQLQTYVAIKEFLPAHWAVRESDTISVAPRSGAVERDYQYGLKMFLREAQTLARFRHERIIRVIQFLQANNTAYLVMEYEHGASLAAKIQDENHSTGENWIRSLLVESVKGLAVVHEASILHRDIKPSNIYIREDDSPVLLDFGSARYALCGQTMSLTSIVSPGYAPFEQYLSDGDQGPWTDFYGLGATLYWVITGNKPTDATARMAAVAEGREDPNVPLSHCAEATYSQALLECIDWMLEPNTENRPQTAQSIMHRVQGMSQPGMSTVSVPVSIDPVATTTPAGRNRRMLFGILGLGLLVVAASYVAFEHDSDSESSVKPYSIAGQDSSASTQGRDSLPFLETEVEMPAPDIRAQSQTFVEQPRGTTKQSGTGQVDRLLQAGDLAFLGYRLTSPAHDSAVYFYQEALELAPDNDRAIAGLDRVIATYVSMAEQAQAQGAVEKANQYLELASSVDPKHPEILAAKRRRALEQEQPISADRFEVGRSSLMDPVETKPGPDSVSLSEKVYSAPSGSSWMDENSRRNSIDEFLRAGDLALVDYRLTTPSQDSAAYYYTEVLKLSPKNQRAVDGLNKVIARYLLLAEQQWDKGNVGKARQYLARAASVNPKHPEIVAARARMVLTYGSPGRRNHTDRSSPGKSGLTSRFPNVRAAKTGYNNGQISKTEYAKIREVLANRYKQRIQSLKQLYRQGKLTKRQYKSGVREAKSAYKG